ncbi:MULTISPECIES: hypothetical protein [Streptomyces]|uniref:hypothetical protein n=1 Tax=Streptomyces TaxID=1883 RepID=UPI000A6E65C1|nr:hypothetical protein [Streptomyces sp. NRRL S-146]
MTREERRAYIRQLVDDAPPLSPEDADLLRALVPMGARRSAQRTPALQKQNRPARRSAA